MGNAIYINPSFIGTQAQAATFNDVITAKTAIDITVADGTNDIGFTITNNDTTNNPQCSKIVNTTTGAVLEVADA